MVIGSLNSVLEYSYVTATDDDVAIIWNTAICNIYVMSGFWKRIKKRPQRQNISRDEWLKSPIGLKER